MTGRVDVDGSYASSGVRGERNARADRELGVSVASTDGAVRFGSMGRFGSVWVGSSEFVENLF